MMSTKVEIAKKNLSNARFALEEARNKLELARNAYNKAVDELVAAAKQEAKDDE